MTLYKGSQVWNSLCRGIHLCFLEWAHGPTLDLSIGQQALDTSKATVPSVPKQKTQQGKGKKASPVKSKEKEKAPSQEKWKRKTAESPAEGAPKKNQLASALQVVKSVRINPRKFLHPFRGFLPYERCHSPWAFVNLFLVISLFYKLASDCLGVSRKGGTFLLYLDEETVTAMMVDES